MSDTSFDSARIAQGYKNRPFLHGQALEQFVRKTGKTRFRNGLDIGCGAGLSTRALRTICDRVTGIDVSEEMIRVAGEACKNDPGIRFLVGRGEKIPGAAGNLDIVTAAGAIQWIDREGLLECLKNRMLPGGYLLIYDFSISDRMENCPQYTEWWEGQYLKRFPRPYRDEAVWTEKDVEKYGFAVQYQTPLKLRYEFSLERFVEFMMIQSNVNVRIEEEGMDADEIRSWFADSLEPVFAGENRVGIFRGYSWCFHKGFRCCAAGYPGL